MIFRWSAIRRLPSMIPTFPVGDAKLTTCPTEIRRLLELVRLTVEIIDLGRSLFYTPQALTLPATEVDAMFDFWQHFS